MTAVLRIGLAVLALAELLIGGWNLLAPENFYANFPGVNLTPPFAEHYARDFGGATLGIAIVLVAAAIIPRTVLVIPALLAISAFAVPHAVFHLEHLHDVGPDLLLFVVVTTLGEAVAALVLLAVALVRWQRERSNRTEQVLPMES
ncbi:hypothetical protein [Pseudolysinimonas sp.]|uniref:hypothetical protein n=1 Tax=Pseudolysinimonas sp. TaxID=2680009 RepID=UPI003267DF82